MIYAMPAIYEIQFNIFYNLFLQHVVPVSTQYTPQAVVNNALNKIKVIYLYIYMNIHLK